MHCLCRVAASLLHSLTHSLGNSLGNSHGNSLGNSLGNCQYNTDILHCLALKCHPLTRSLTQYVTVATLYCNEQQLPHSFTPSLTHLSPSLDILPCEPLRHSLTHTLSVALQSEQKTPQVNSAINSGNNSSSLTHLRTHSLTHSHSRTLNCHTSISPKLGPPTFSNQSPSFG